MTTDSTPTSAAAGRLFSLFAHRVSPQVVSGAAAVASLLTERGVAVELCPELYRELRRVGSLPCDAAEAAEPSERSSAIISIGGDGTFLQAARWDGSREIPIAGLNAGHLGYLASWRLDQSRTFVAELLAGEFAVERRALQKVESPLIPEQEWPYALNETALLKENTASMISVRTLIGDEFLTDYLGDGLIVSTPTGSTGYNLSAGGPILEPGIDTWVLSPVAPHSLNMRPIVVSSSHALALKGRSRSGRFLLSLDGRSLSLPSGSEIRIVRAPFVIPVVHRKSLHFVGRVREKLLWGIHPASSQASDE